MQQEGSLETARAATYIIDYTKEMSITKRPLVIICPGGGYEYTSEREGEIFALRWNSCGYHAIVLDYSVAPATYPTALLELGTVVKMVREKAEEWLIDTDKIIIQGSSAGGHLAASYGMFWKKEFMSDTLHISAELLKPNGLILNYPVITSGPYAHRGSFEMLLGEQYDSLVEEMSLERQVTKDMPTTFIWSTDEDTVVPAENALLLALAMRKAGVPLELHIFREGNHGLGFGDETSVDYCGNHIVPATSPWFELAHTWVRQQFPIVV